MRNKIIWLTGLPCSGKSTIAYNLASRINAEVLDGDVIRKFMGNIDFSIEGRKEHMLSVAEIAYRFSKYTNVLVSLVSPIRKTRNEILDMYDNMNMIYCDCPLEICEERDVKGMYAKARAGEVKDFTGVSAEYEKPIEGDNHYSINTNKKSLEECVNLIENKFFKEPEYML